MLTLNLMQNIHIAPKPIGQIVTATLLVGPSFHIPGRPTDIVIEGLERIPRTGPVYLAMNHTDRFNYWPIQYKMWRQRDPIYTASWVKGKYFNNSMIAKFMLATNNIPTPSRGYLITSDALSLLKQPPQDATYRLLRDELNAFTRDPIALHRHARTHGVLDEIERITTTPRSLLGYAFEPSKESYFEAIDHLFGLMMNLFVGLNHQAFDHGHKIIVFPEGTRSTTLLKGRTGLAQMALRTKATIVPIGCNGSELLYPGSSPISRGGRVVYRVGEPLTPKDDLKDFSMAHDFIPFTPDAERRFGDIFTKATDLIMQRIAELLDPKYLHTHASNDAVQGSRRFL